MKKTAVLAMIVCSIFLVACSRSEMAEMKEVNFRISKAKFEEYGDGSTMLALTLGTGSYTNKVLVRPENVSLKVIGTQLFQNAPEVKAAYFAYKEKSPYLFGARDGFENVDYLERATIYVKEDEMLSWQVALDSVLKPDRIWPAPLE